MKIHVKILIVLLLAPVMFACAGKKPVNNSGGAEETVTAVKNRKLVLPAIPAMIIDSVGRINYLVAHYWDNFDFNDTTLIHEPDITEQGIVDHLNLFRFVSTEHAANSVIAVLKKAEKEKTGRMYSYFVETLREYLYEPNSVVKNEEVYIPVTRYIIDNSKSNLTEIENAKYLQKVMMKNRTGSVAADFKYSLQSGKQGSLHKLEAPYTLLMFYDPDCSGCANTVNYMKTAPVIINGIKQGSLKILAFYADNDVEMWTKHLNDIPSEWINGYDKGRIVKGQDMYDLKGMPAIYLLDEDKRIILKGVMIPDVMEFLKKVKSWEWKFRQSVGLTMIVGRCDSACK